MHRPVFDALVAAIDATAQCVTIVDDELLADARSDGPDDSEVVVRIARRLDELVAMGADRIVCTCSTIGGSAESVGQRRGIDVERVDRAMVEGAVAIGGWIVVLAALESTLEPTRALLNEVAAARQQTTAVDLRIVAGAWDRFEAGDIDGYLDLVADAIDEVGNTADAVVLAQASMADAAGRSTGGVPVFSSPRLAVESAITNANRRRRP